jgi:hypothetical protein
MSCSCEHSTEFSSSLNAGYILSNSSNSETVRFSRKTFLHELIYLVKMSRVNGDVIFVTFLALVFKQVKARNDVALVLVTGRQETLLILM